MMRIAKKFQEQICVSRLTDGQKKIILKRHFKNKIKIHA
jgi:hypothetical protein